MAADSRASSREMQGIHKVMTAVAAPWSTASVDTYIEEFVVRVQRDGYRVTLANSLRNVVIFKKIGQANLLIDCLASVAKADGEVTDREVQLCRRIKTLVE